MLSTSSSHSPHHSRSCPSPPPNNLSARIIISPLHNWPGKTVALLQKGMGLIGEEGQTQSAISKNCKLSRKWTGKTYNSAHQRWSQNKLVNIGSVRYFNREISELGITEVLDKLSTQSSLEINQKLNMKFCAWSGETQESLVESEGQGRPENWLDFEYFPSNKQIISKVEDRNLKGSGH